MRQLPQGIGYSLYLRQLQQEILRNQFLARGTCTPYTQIRKIGVYLPIHTGSPCRILSFIPESLGQGRRASLTCGVDVCAGDLETADAAVQALWLLVKGNQKLLRPEVEAMGRPGTLLVKPLWDIILGTASEQAVRLSRSGTLVAVPG